MIKHQLYLIIIVGIILTSCTKNKNSSDLSFGGITIGETLPDSLIKHGDFKLINSSLPTYIGYISFNFPNSKNVSIKTRVECNIDTKEVFMIELMDLGFSNIDDFYHMLVSKYGEPTVGGIKDKLNFFSMYRDLYKKYKDAQFYGENPVILGQWEPIGYNSIIQIYSYPIFIAKGNGEDIFIRYFNKIETEKNYKKSIDNYNSEKNKREMEEKKIKKEEYRKKNEETLKQDF